VTVTGDIFTGEAARGTVFNVQYFNLHDGPGVRTLVFFKGCPLRCHWCSNPESMSRLPELGLKRALCDRCGKCLEACPEQALFFNDDDVLSVDRQRCKACGKCVSVCYPEALTVYGKEMTAEEVFDEVFRDKMFYEGTGGGITVSGGEPLQQPHFLLAVLRLCRNAGIHTCLETTGCTTADVLEQILEVTDHVLFDLKHMDSRLHQKFTGKPNKQILANARRVAESRIPVIFRMPLVPGFNDTPQNIGATADFVKSLKMDNIRGLELMPYHRMGMGKYESLDRQYALNNVQPSEPDYVESIRQRFEEFGIICTVSR
jgi:pyruvate formate lyase activating enzyme